MPSIGHAHLMHRRINRISRRRKSVLTCVTDEGFDRKEREREREGEREPEPEAETEIEWAERDACSETDREKYRGHEEEVEGDIGREWKIELRVYDKE